MERLNVTFKNICDSQNKSLMNLFPFSLFPFLFGFFLPFLPLAMSRLQKGEADRGVFLGARGVTPACGG